MSKEVIAKIKIPDDLPDLVNAVVEVNKDLQTKIDKAIKLLEADMYVENIYMALCWLFGTDRYDYEDLSVIAKDILKGE